MSSDLVSLSRQGPVHFMGIGGVGMCALAELLIREGGLVSGCDLKDGESSRKLARLGARVDEGHDASHLDGASALVMTAAVRHDHPEVERARALGIPVLDGLGISGDGAHAVHEHIEADDIARRGALIGGLLVSE